MSDISLSQNFRLSHLIHSDEALKLGMDNSPKDDGVITNLRALAVNVLELVHKNFSSPVTISSGYRCPELNAHVGGVPTSQHQKGEAADFVVDGYDCLLVAQWIAKNLDFDQLILENYFPDQGESGYLHCSYVSYKPNRKSLLTYDGKKYHAGILSPEELKKLEI